MIATLNKLYSIDMNLPSSYDWCDCGLIWSWLAYLTLFCLIFQCLFHIHSQKREQREQRRVAPENVHTVLEQMARRVPQETQENTGAASERRGKMM